MLFDSHCHPQFPHYDQDRDETIKHALKEGVFMICVGTDLKTSEKGIELTRSYEGIWASVGLHPTDIHETYNMKLETWEESLKEDKVVAVGEVGLDYYRVKDNKSRAKQKEVLNRFLELADKYRKPLIFHCRDAHKEMINLLSEWCSIHDRDINTNLLGVIHSFTGTLEEAKKYLELGLYLGFNGIITFTNQYNETVRYAPLEKILLETDAPFLTPVPFRGKRNEPLYVKHVAEKIAELKGLSYSQVAEKTFENTKKLFNL